MANLIQLLRGTVRRFTASGQTPDTILTLTSLASSALRISDRWDRGALAQPERFIWRAWFKPTSAPTLGSQISLYLATGDGTHADGTPGTVDAAINAEYRRNMIFMGVVEVDDTSAVREYCGSGAILILERYVQIAAYNELGIALSGTAADHGVTLTPAEPQIQ